VPQKLDTAGGVVRHAVRGLDRYDEYVVSGRSAEVVDVTDPDNIVDLLNAALGGVAPLRVSLSHSREAGL
jgi:hypothetical protein